RSRTLRTDSSCCPGRTRRQGGFLRPRPALVRRRGAVAGPLSGTTRSSWRAMTKLRSCWQKHAARWLAAVTMTPPRLQDRHRLTVHFQTDPPEPPQKIEMSTFVDGHKLQDPAQGGIAAAKPSSQVLIGQPRRPFLEHRVDDHCQAIVIRKLPFVREGHRLHVG